MEKQSDFFVEVTPLSQRGPFAQLGSMLLAGEITVEGTLAVASPIDPFAGGWRGRDRNQACGLPSEAAETSKKLAWEHQLAKELVIESLHRDAHRLVQSLARYDHLLVALSGGVDSSLVAAAAARATPRRLVAVTADSPSVPRWQLEMARKIADELGIEHQVVSTDEIDLAEYQQNDRRRCFYCKQTLYRTVQSWAQSQFGSSAETIRIASGTNADDLGDYRPGIEAGRESGVLTPLADLGIGKDSVRQLARHFGLSNHDLPAAPCLASRIAYGTEVTPERLQRIEQAEAMLRDIGFTQVRVRVHEGDLARIEVTRDEIPRLCELEREKKLSQSLRALGFPFVTVDLEGFQSGSLNRALVSIGLPRESSNIDPSNAESSNAESSNAESSNAESSNAESSNVEPSSVEPSSESGSKEALS